MRSETVRRSQDPPLEHEDGRSFAKIVPLTGGLYAEHKRCNRPTCQCAAGGDALHGPYLYRCWRAGARLHCQYVKAADAAHVRAALHTWRAPADDRSCSAPAPASEHGGKVRSKRGKRSKSTPSRPFHAFYTYYALRPCADRRCNGRQDPDHRQPWVAVGSGGHRGCPCLPRTPGISGASGEQTWKTFDHAANAPWVELTAAVARASWSEDALLTDLVYVHRRVVTGSPMLTGDGV
jgi:hypothetical protein